MAEDVGDALILSVNVQLNPGFQILGASFHYTLHLEIMENYVSGDFKKIHPTDDETLKITRKDNIQVKLPSEIVWKLKDVRFIPSLKKNNLGEST